MRVLIPLIILMELEERTTRSVTSMFNFFGGTSFAALIINAMNVSKGGEQSGYPKHDLLEILNFIKDNKDKIFSPTKAFKKASQS